MIASTKFNKFFKTFFFNLEKSPKVFFQSAFGFQIKVHKGSIKGALGFIWCTVKWTLVRYQLNPYAIEPRVLFLEFNKTNKFIFCFCKIY